MDLQPRSDGYVNQVWAPPTPPLGKDGKTLMVQMGGVENVTQWVYGFYDKMLADKEIAPFLENCQATQSFDVYMKLLKYRAAEYLKTVWGGDTWEGQDMFCDHPFLHITPKAFDKAIELGKKQAKSMGLSSAVVDQIVQDMLVKKEPMTDPDGLNEGSKSVMEPPSFEHPGIRGSAGKILEEKEKTEIILPDPPSDEHLGAFMPRSVVAPKFRAFFGGISDHDHMGRFLRVPSAPPASETLH